ncbi:hypothetical protein [Lichenifustis flavocetrariae]|uniref:Core-binding (CB) domain-containing protein n=1 Tax=Lichenifustis flavocetrariae TaxID=2949735 RepID=A0AA41Z6I5_9HYPH|nr:hypothetical protein [Lichenifustis flavocetrariae]MCW6510182.1 hypothetical protein [Lichenifustis flavocetrariae]
MRAQVRANDVIKERDLGAPIVTPERPSLITPPEVPTATVETLSALRLRWIKLNRPSPKQIDDNALYVSYFVQLFGDLPVNEVTKKQVIAFRDKLLDRPRNVPNKLAKSSLAEQIAWGATTKAPRLSRGTINAKGIGSVSTLMRIALDDELITINPCAGTRLKLDDRDVVDREPYSPAELNAIVASKIYQVPARISKAG